MSGLAGLDINGLWDHAVTRHPDTDEDLVRDAGINGAVVRLNQEQEIWLGDVQAALAPHGRGDGWGKLGGREFRLPVAEILSAILDDQIDDRHRHAFDALVRALSGEAERIVLAVSDAPEFGEGARDRLLRVLQHRRVTLLWRPIAAILGWVKTSDGARLQDGTRVAVISLLRDGVHLAAEKLVPESSASGRLWVPERSRSGLTVTGLPGAKALADKYAAAVADQLGRRIVDVLAETRSPWHHAVGDPLSDELVRMPNRSWRRMPKPEAVGMPAARSLEDVTEHIDGADFVLLEGPASANRRWANTILEALGIDGNDERVRFLPREAAAQGCLDAARRLALGLPVYYDFLPQLEINARVRDEPSFVELIPEGARLLGGTSYRREAPGDFAINRGADRLVFYLFKEDFDKGRRASVPLPAEPDRQHRISVTVEQTPGQGFARIRIGSDSFEPLRHHPLELDWSRMETIDETRDEILEKLSGEGGLAYPEAIVIPGHPVHWHPENRLGDLIAQLEDYCRRPLWQSGRPNAEALKSLETLRDRLSKRRSPSYEAKKFNLHSSENAGAWALDSNGAVPEDRDGFSAPENASDLLAQALNKAALDFEQLDSQYGAASEPKIAGHLIGFTTWCYWRCPEPIVSFLFDVMEGRQQLPGRIALIREGLGRTLHHSASIHRYFDAIERNLIAGGRLKANELSAIARLLGSCSVAADLLPPKTASLILKEACNQIDAENRLPCSNAFKRKYKTSLLMLAALLRHRKTDPTFLDPNSDENARTLLTLSKASLELMDICQSAAEDRRGRASGAQRSSLTADIRRLDRTKEILRDLIDFINLKGRDPNIIVKIVGIDDGEADGDEVDDK